MEKCPTNISSYRWSLIGPLYKSFYRESRICKNIGGLGYIGHVVVCFCLVSPLDIRTTRQQQQQEQPEKVPDSHGRFFESWPWQKVKREIQIS